MKFGTRNLHVMSVRNCELRGVNVRRASQNGVIFFLYLLRLPSDLEKKLNKGDFHKNIINVSGRRESQRGDSHTSHTLHRYNFVSFRINTR